MSAGRFRCGSWVRFENEPRETWMRPDESADGELKVTWATVVFRAKDDRWTWEAWDPGEFGPDGSVNRAGSTGDHGRAATREEAMAAADVAAVRWWTGIGERATPESVAELLALAEALP